MVKGFRKLKYGDRLYGRIYFLERRRLRGDLIEACKILTGKDRVNKDKFYALCSMDMDYEDTAKNSSSQGVKLQQERHSLPTEYKK